MLELCSVWLKVVVWRDCVCAGFVPRVCAAGFLLMRVRICHFYVVTSSVLIGPVLCIKGGDDDLCDDYHGCDVLLLWLVLVVTVNGCVWCCAILLYVSCDSVLPSLLCLQVLAFITLALGFWKETESLAFGWDERLVPELGEEKGMSVVAGVNLDSFFDWFRPFLDFWMF